MTNNPTILYESGPYFVIGSAKAFEIYRNDAVGAVRCGIVGRSLGLSRAIREVERRQHASFMAPPTEQP